ncbi:hypothetical protein HELRODRAFT_66664 [Helobdella robusta]|uniref:Transmembrane 9 superfamily member n=1 Tax=Helobdella robusta TaxID=6412 RepID=T1FYN6_HELRO|nr:hypothetical protein HELRODRAFT_66664 [Helobdella robusta]ESN98735.1 hypothetical protein HELRODRAFT_66664 [Helobdella robusta]
MLVIVRLLLPILVLQLSHGFYVPGVAPRDFSDGESLDIKAVKLTSVKAQLPYDYYSLPFCKPDKIEYKPENLGCEVLRGDRIVNTDYKVQMNRPVECQVMCVANLTSDETKMLNKFIRQAYTVHLLTDNLPCSTPIKSTKSEEEQYEHGYRLGIVKDDKVYLHNHIKMMLDYHLEDGLVDNSYIYRVVGFKVESISQAWKDLKSASCKDSTAKAGDLLEIPAEGAMKIPFTYKVEWKSSPVKWASRWDTYLAMNDVEIHWFSIINSVVVVLFLSGILTMIIVRTLRRDIAKYNKIDEEDEALEESGWKLVHGDVFRPPQRPQLLAALIGSGIQIFCVIFIVIVFAMLGMLSPASRGALMTAGIFLFMFMGLIAGYYSARLYKTMKGIKWKKAAFLTGTFYLSIVFGTCFFLNFFLIGKHSSGAVPFTTMVALVCMWTGISVPLVFVGYFFGSRKQSYEHPVRTNQIPRQVPDQQWYLHPVVATLLAGILPFGAMFIELFFMFSAIWENQFYYLFGFLFLVFIILIISCSQISIVMVYFQLCGEDYHWWWRSFIVSGGSAVYVFIYSIFYFVTKLEITEFIPTLLYFGYTALMVLTFWLLTGTIGFYASYFFIRKIYAAIKID